MLLFLIVRRFLYYQKRIEISIKKKDYASALFYAKMIGNWWLMSYLKEKIEKDFTKLRSQQAVNCIEALISVGEEKRARKLLFIEARKRKDCEVLLNWFWKEVQE